MTSAELTALRTALYTQYLAWITSGCPQSTTVNGRTLQRVDHTFWQKQLNDFDAQLAGINGTGCFVAQARDPE